MTVSSVTTADNEHIINELDSCNVSVLHMTNATKLGADYNIVKQMRIFADGYKFKLNCTIFVLSNELTRNNIIQRGFKEFQYTFGMRIVCLTSHASKVDAYRSLADEGFDISHLFKDFPRRHHDHLVDQQEQPSTEEASMKTAMIPHSNNLQAADI